MTEALHPHLHEQFYCENPEFKERFPDLADKILKRVKNAHAIDHFNWFRFKYGPVLIPFSGQFFDEVIDRMACGDKVFNIEPFDRLDPADMRIDMLEVLGMLIEALYAFDDIQNERRP